MAYNNTNPRAEYTASASQTVFPFLFKIYSDTDIIVYLTPNGQDPNDTTDLLVLTTDYTVTINGDNGGEITLTSGTTSGDSVTLVRNLPIGRYTEYQTSGDLLASTLNEDQEYQTYLTADTNETFSRVITLPQNAQGVDNFLPSPLPEQYIRWSADGKSLINDTTLPSATQDAIDAANDSATQAGIATAKALEASNSATSASNDLATFQGQYQSSPTAPTTPTEGDLWFDESINLMKVYNGIGWQLASSAVNGTSSRNTYIATEGQTTFSATYDTGYVDVYVNGLKTVEFTATDGSNVVLDSGVSAGTIVEIVAYGTFELADAYTKADADVLLDAKADTTYVDTNKLDKSGGTITGDLTVSGEYKGKNACTAWVRFNGDTPTIYDSFNVGSIIKLNSYTYEVYFLVPMDNQYYSVVSGETDSINRSVCSTESTIFKTVLEIRRTTDGTGPDSNNNIAMIVFGGKN